MTKEEFYMKWQPNGFYQHNPNEFMADIDSVIKTEQSHQAAVSGSLPIPPLSDEMEDKMFKETTGNDR